MKGNGFLGPNRANFMTWVADQVGIQDMGKAQAEAYLKSVYGDNFKLPEDPRQIAGGRIDSGQHIDLGGLLRQRPKSSLGPWIFASVLVLVAAALGLGWAFSQGKPTPGFNGQVQVPGGIQWEGRPFQP